MRRSQFTDDEIIRLLREADGGTPVSEICRTAAVSMRTFYRWRQRFNGMEPAELSEMRALQIENRRLRAVLEDLVRGPGMARPRGSAAPSPVQEQDHHGGAPSSRGGMLYYASLRARP
ncbi:transposase [Flaviflagellibacter deserti]|uniref:Transposase n=1 Tax=Flaviflagellibacter deserti TaxID=2267266 RepID=A0ABV9Z539_9HYPH